MESQQNAGPTGWLPRLAKEAYLARAVVFWTHTVKDRATGWLNPLFHSGFREMLLHAAVRENLLCPIYTLMPDHLHLVWMGISENSDQRLATRFLREMLGTRLSSAKWQHQPHDRVLRQEERRRKAFELAVGYIATNPVRAGLVTTPDQWIYTGCVVPGYPDLHPLEPDFWPKYWRFYKAGVAQSGIGKIRAL